MLLPLPLPPWPCLPPPLRLATPDLTLSNLADGNSVAYWYAGGGFSPSPDIDLVGSSVQAWRSRVGSHTLTPVAAAPTLTVQEPKLKNRAAVAFNGSRLSSLAPVLSALSTWTLYAVLRPTTSIAQTWFGEANAGATAYQRFQINDFGVVGGSGLHRKNDAGLLQDRGSGNVYANLDPVLLTMTFDGTRFKNYVNGRLMGDDALTTPVGVITAVNLSLGGNSSGGSFTGDIALVLIQSNVETSKIVQIAAAYGLPVAYAVPLVDPLQTIYIDPIGGNDTTGTGALAAPYKTFGRTSWRWKPGGKLIVRGGICPEAISNVFPTGAPLYPTTLTVYPGETCTIHPASSVSRAIYNDIGGRDWLVIDGAFVIDGTNLTIEGAKFTASDHLTLRGLTVHNCPVQGILIDSDCYTVTLDQITAYSNGTTPGLDHNLYIKARERITVTNCLLFGAVGYGLQIRGGSDYNTIINIHDNEAYGNNNGGLVIEYGLGRAIDGVGIYQNNFHNNNGGGMIIRVACGGSLLEVYDNTCNNNLGTGISLGPLTTDPTHLLVRDNTANGNGLYGLYLNQQAVINPATQSYWLESNHLSGNLKQFELLLTTMAGMTFLWDSGESPLRDGLKAYWNFNNNLLDEIGGHHWTLDTGVLPTFVAGRGLSKPALLLNQAGTLQTPASTDFNPTDNLTILAGLKPSGMLGNRVLFSSALGANRSWRIASNSSPTIVALGRNGSGVDTVVGANGTANPSGWDYYRYQYTFSSSILTAGRNLGMSAGVVVSGGIQNLNADLSLGGDDLGAQLWQGSVDCLGLWKRLFSASEMIWIDNAGKGLPFPFETTV